VNTEIFTQREIPDYMTKHGANMLCHRLAKYYKDNGIEGAEFYIVPRALPSHDGQEILTVQYDVRSNLTFKVPKS